MEKKETLPARLGGWAARHKMLLAALAILLVPGILAARTFFGKAAPTGAPYSFVRTTTLEKTTLSDTVIVTGTVRSGEEASVTVADGAKTYKVAAVNVQVGDTVKKGDVIATLDTADLEKQIESAEQNYNDSLQSAQTAYDRAVDDFAVGAVRHENTLIDLQAAIDAADEDLGDAQTALEKARADRDGASSALAAARSRYDAVNAKYREAETQVSAFAAEAQAAAQAQSDALNAWNADPANEELKAQYEAAARRSEEAEQSLAGARAGVSVTDDALGLSLYGWDAVESERGAAQQAITAAEQTLAQAETALAQAETAAEQAESKVKSARDQYDNEKNYSALKSQNQQVEDAASKLEQTSRTPDSLEVLRATLADCTLTATMDGTVTALNATVGSVCAGTVATIQNIQKLTVDVTIPANSMRAVQVGMPCRITSDATGDTVIHGTLSRIDPVANEQGSFGATVTVEGAAADLLIGVQARAEIIVREKTGVFTVPIDAVGTDENGGRYVLRRTGGEGVNMTFEEVPVTVGDANDFYTEVSGELAEGDVIRASADLNEGIETAQTMDPMMMPGAVVPHASSNGAPGGL